MREEIEHMDVNLVRYNVKKESEEFVKKIKAFNTDKTVTALKDDDDDDSAKCAFCCQKVNRHLYLLKFC
jgi:hypothetical protein